MGVGKSLKCLDGRIKDKEGIYGFPGGDTGLFLLVLNQYEKIINKTLLPSEIKNLFESYTKSMDQNKFYMCTDLKAIDWLERNINFEGLDIANPRDNIKESILKSLDNYYMHGDVLIKMLLKYSDKMKIRKMLVVEFL